MLTPEMLDALQEQMNIERGNAAFYKACSLALEAARWPGSAAWFAKSANEEQDHSDRIARHIIDRTGPMDATTRPEYEEVPAPGAPNSAMPLDFFTEAYSAEVANTARLRDIFANARESEDYQTEVFLHWFIDEQTKSEADLADIIVEVTRAGNDQAALLALDEKYGE